MLVGGVVVCFVIYVALRKESVDRNGCILGHFGQAARRSPQGERG